MFMKSCNCIVVTLRHSVPLRGSTHRLIVARSDSTFILRWCKHSAEVTHTMIIWLFIYQYFIDKHWNCLLLLLLCVLSRHSLLMMNAAELSHSFVEVSLC